MNNEDVIKKEVEKRLNDMLSTVDMHKIVTVDSKAGIVYIGGERVDKMRLNNLRQEAEAISQFELWSLLMETPKELAQRAMFVNSESLDDLKKGKTILYTIDTQQKIVNTLKNVKI
jgi:hypothetical protein